MNDIPPTSPVQPVKLSLEDTIQFRCHKEISCFNQCCQCIDIQLTPYDILRLKNHLNLTSKEFLAQYTLPFEMDADGLPGVKLKPVGESTVCPFVTQEGCNVYQDRPTVCRYYALGLLSMRYQGSPTDDTAYVLIKEDHCLGHQEARRLTVREYRQEQGVEEYDEMNQGWRQIILKKRSAGPTLGKPSARSHQFFFLGSYHLDGLRDFISSEGFAEIYDLSEEELQRLKLEDTALMKFGFRLLKQVLFGEMTIPVKGDALEKRVHRNRGLNGVDPEDPNKDYIGPILV